MENTCHGVIVKGIGGFYYARNDEGEVFTLRARGKFRKQHLTPLVGDRVTFTPGNGDEEGWIDELLPRDSELIRPAVANIKYIMLVAAPKPQPDLLLLDTLTVMAVKQGITPIFVVNKCDLDDGLYEDLKAQYADIGTPVMRVSAKTGEGIEELRALLREGICCFAGQSGVGKSTLVSAATGL